MRRGSIRGCSPSWGPPLNLRCRSTPVLACGNSPNNRTKCVGMCRVCWSIDFNKRSFLDRAPTCEARRFSVRMSTICRCSGQGTTVLQASRSPVFPGGFEGLFSLMRGLSVVCNTCVEPQYQWRHSEPRKHANYRKRVNSRPGTVKGTGNTVTRTARCAGQCGKAWRKSARGEAGL